MSPFPPWHSDDPFASTDPRDYLLEECADDPDDTSDTGDAT